jgi:AhpD family alkylhydroperoxidase
MKAIMDEKTKELIAIGASIGAHCQPCLTYHVNKAKELGADADLIRAAINVGHMVEKGAMAAMREFANDVFDAPVQKVPACCGGKSN